MNDIIRIAKTAAAESLKPITGPDEVNGGGDGDIQSRIIDILNVIIGLLSVVCVIVIVIGGVQYMTSTGDAGKVKKAKDTIMYAIIGLVVCGLAAVIVNFVVKQLLGL